MTPASRSTWRAANFIIHEHHTCNRMDTCLGLTKYNLQPENGYFTVPDLPGIGNEFLQEAIDRATLYKVVEAPV